VIHYPFVSKRDQILRQIKECKKCTNCQFSWQQQFWRVWNFNKVGQI